MMMIKKFVGLAACGLFLGVSQASQATGVGFEDLGIPLGTQVSPNCFTSIKPYGFATIKDRKTANA